MARSVSDARLLFEVLAGNDDRDPFSAPVPLQPANLEGLRIGVVEQWYDVPVQPAIRRAVRAAAEALAGLGFAVEEFRPEGLERAPNLWSFLFSELPARAMKDRIVGREAEAHWTSTGESRQDAGAAAGVGLAGDGGRFRQRDAMRRRLLEQMRKFPVLLMPVCSIAAFQHRNRRFDTEAKPVGLFQAMMPATTFNLLGLPGLAIPFGMSEDGLPVGVQLVGRPWGEETLLEVGVTRWKEARGVFSSPKI
jgi:Asp-tRNA(Asn)/Glu-tRNA(Gln) amidotransferase A subunit family amidase